MPHRVAPIHRVLALLAGMALALTVATAQGENLDQAWATALNADYRLEATRWSTSAAGHSLEAARGNAHAQCLGARWLRGS